MASVYDEDAFKTRVDYAARCIVAGRTSSRSFDATGEMNDGELVAVALYRRSLKNQKLADKLWKVLHKGTVMKYAEKWAHVPDRDLEEVARQERCRQKESNVN